VATFYYMSMSEPSAANLERDDLAGRTRAEVHEPLEKQLAPLGHRAMLSLSAGRGERILDVGCGTGQTSGELGLIVGPGGEVLGIDLSAAVLETATRTAGNCAQVRFVQGDAQVFPFDFGTYDAAFSRFGVMFFADPVMAFANIRQALKPAGRLAFVCWRSLEENDLDIVPLRAAFPYLPPDVPKPGSAPAFSFAKPDRARDILAEAGFEDIEFTAYDEQVGSGDPESMLELSLRVGSLGKIVREAPELRAVVIEPVRKALAAYDGPEGLRLKAATWIVTARSSSRS
jgi:SAM-dependent methyltransferase